MIGSTMAWKRSRVRIPIASQLYTQVRAYDRSLSGFGLRQLGAESGANRERAAPRPRFGREQREQTCGQIGPDLRLLVRACAQTLHGTPASVAALTAAEALTHEHG